MAPHDWDALYEQLEKATGTWSREELVGLLRDLVREYVIERGLPTGSPQQAAVDLSTMDFPGLINHLKRTCNLAELQRFQVEGRRVIVDLDGPREFRAPRAAAAPGAPAASQSSPGSSSPAPSPGPAAAPAHEPATPASEAQRAAPARPVSRRFKNLEFD